MNTQKITELENRTKAILEEIELLKQEISQQPQNRERWRAENGGTYYFIDKDGSIGEEVEEFEEFDDAYSPPTTTTAPAKKQSRQTVFN